MLEAQTFNERMKIYLKIISMCLMHLYLYIYDAASGNHLNPTHFELRIFKFAML